MAKFKEIQIDPVPQTVDRAPRSKRKRAPKQANKSRKKADSGNSQTIIVTIFCIIVGIIVAGAAWFFGFSEWGFAWSGNMAKMSTKAPENVVTEYPSVTLSMNEVALILESGANTVLNAEVHKNNSSKHINAEDLILRWHSENPNVARVNQKGKITAVHEGTARVMVTVGNDDINSNTVYCIVTVKGQKKGRREKVEGKR